MSHSSTTERTALAMAASLADATQEIRFTDAARQP